MSDEGVWRCVIQAKLTYFDVKLHFGDEQFEVDAAQLSIAFAQVSLRMREMLTQEGGNVIKVRAKKKNVHIGWQKTTGGSQFYAT